MNVIIERSIVISRKFLEDYAAYEECVHIGRTLALQLGLNGLSGEVLKGYYVKIPVIALDMRGYAAGPDWGQRCMALVSYNASRSPGQLGLLILISEGTRFLGYVK